jgi:CDP-glycerol glycerophosphotransferase (TagB/SpsB family)
MSEEAITQMRQSFAARHGLSQQAPIVVFAVPHTGALKGSLDHLLRDLIEFFSVNTHLYLIIRFHPFEPWFAQSLSGLSENSANIRVDQDTASLDLIVSTDLCLCQRSTIGLEYLAFGKPVVELNYQHSSSDSTSFFNQGIAALITQKSQFPLIEQTLADYGRRASSQKIEETVKKYFFKTDGQTNLRISEHIKTTLSAKR